MSEEKTKGGENKREEGTEQPLLLNYQNSPLHFNSSAFSTSLPNENPTREKRNVFRRLLPQVIATTGFGMLIFAVSAICTMSTVVIGANHKTNKSEIFFTDQDASWFGSIVYIVQPIGSLTSGFIQDSIGRKKCMMGVTIPQFIGWIMLYLSPSIELLYTAAVIMGLSIGFMEAPSMSYLGEVIEPKYRGTLSTFSEVFLLIGILFEFFMGAILYWRYACLVSALVPLSVFIIIYMIPESPTWLIVQGRIEEAESALRWLRGWTTRSEISVEFKSLLDSLNQSHQTQPLKQKSTVEPLPTEGEAGRVGKIREALSKFKLLTEPRIRRPIILISVFFFIGHCTTLLGARPFLVEIFTDMNLPVTPYWVLVATGSAQLIGSIFGSLLIHKIGKRSLAFTSLSGTIIGCYILSGYLYSGWDYPNFAVGSLGLIYFCTGLGVMPLPWTLVSELFPLDGRGLAAGLTAAHCYIFYFIVTKTFVDLKNSMSFSGVLSLYGSIGVIGFVYLYFRLPETEGKTLAEIELIFNPEKEFGHNKDHKFLDENDTKQDN